MLISNRVLLVVRIMLKDPGFVAQESFYSDELDESSVLGIQTHNEVVYLFIVVYFNLQKDINTVTCHFCKKLEVTG